MRLSDIMSGAGLAAYAEVALLLFMVAFTVIVIRVFQPANKGAFERASRLPLEDNADGNSPTDKEPVS